MDSSSSPRIEPEPRFVDALRALVPTAQPWSAAARIHGFVHSAAQGVHYHVSASEEDGVLWFPRMVTRAFTEKDAHRVPPGATWKECRTMGLRDYVRLVWPANAPPPCLVAGDVVTRAGKTVKRYAAFADDERIFEALCAMPRAARCCYEYLVPGARVRFLLDIDIEKAAEEKAGRPWAPSADGSDPYWVEIMRVVAVARETVARIAGWTPPPDEHEADDALGVVIGTSHRVDKYSYHLLFGDVSFDGLTTMKVVAGQINALLPIPRVDENVYHEGGQCFRFAGNSKVGKASYLRVAYAPRRFTDPAGDHAIQLPCDPIEDNEEELFKASCVCFGADECRFKINAADVPAPSRKRAAPSSGEARRPASGGTPVDVSRASPILLNFWLELQAKFPGVWRVDAATNHRKADGDADDVHIILKPEQGRGVEVRCLVDGATMHDSGRGAVIRVVGGIPIAICLCKGKGHIHRNDALFAAMHEARMRAVAGSAPGSAPVGARSCELLPAVADQCRRILSSADPELAKMYGWRIVNRGFVILEDAFPHHARTRGTPCLLNPGRTHTGRAMVSVWFTVCQRQGVPLDTSKLHFCCELCRRASKSPVKPAKEPCTPEMLAFLQQWHRAVGSEAFEAETAALGRSETVIKEAEDDAAAALSAESQAAALEAAQSRNFIGEQEALANQHAEDARFVLQGLGDVAANTRKLRGSRVSDALAAAGLSLVSASHKMTLVGAFMGAGKTHALIEQIRANPQWKILVFSARIMQAVDAMRRFADLGFTTYMSNGPRVAVSDRFVVSFESLTKYADDLLAREWDLIVMDECETLAANSISPLIYLPVETAKHLSGLLTRAAHIVCMDAFLTEMSVSFVLRAAGYDAGVKEFGYQWLQLESPQESRYIMYYRSSVLLQRMTDFLKDGKNIYFFFSTKKKLHEVRSAILDAGILRKCDILIHINKPNRKSREAIRNVQESWPKYRLVMATSTLSLGVDFSDEGRHFWATFVWATAFGPVARLVHQGVWRVRANATRTTHVFIDGRAEHRPKQFPRIESFADVQKLADPRQCAVQLVLKAKRREAKEAEAEADPAQEGLSHLPDWQQLNQAVELSERRYTMQHPRSEFFRWIEFTGTPLENISVNDEDADADDSSDDDSSSDDGSDSSSAASEEAEDEEIPPLDNIVDAGPIDSIVTRILKTGVRDPLGKDFGKLRLQDRLQIAKIEFKSFWLMENDQNNAFREYFQNRRMCLGVRSVLLKGRMQLSQEGGRFSDTYLPRYDKVKLQALANGAIEEFGITTDGPAVRKSFAEISNFTRRFRAHLLSASCDLGVRMSREKPVAFFDNQALCAALRWAGLVVTEEKADRRSSVTGYKLECHWTRTRINRGERFGIASAPPRTDEPAPAAPESNSGDS